jgi:gliding motility-associated-like protein
MEDYPINELMVYSRWGSKIFTQKNYNNTWDGRSRQTNTILPVGTYFYVLFIENQKKPVKGYVYIKY